MCIKGTLYVHLMYIKYTIYMQCTFMVHELCSCVISLRLTCLGRKIPTLRRYSGDVKCTKATTEHNYDKAADKTLHLTLAPPPYHHFEDICGGVYEQIRAHPPTEISAKT